VNLLPKPTTVAAGDFDAADAVGPAVIFEANCYILVGIHDLGAGDVGKWKEIWGDLRHSFWVSIVKPLDEPLQSTSS
jgi:hypothetical protein